MRALIFFSLSCVYVCVPTRYHHVTATKKTQNLLYPEVADYRFINEDKRGADVHEETL